LRFLGFCGRVASLLGICEGLLALVTVSSQNELFLSNCRVIFGFSSFINNFYKELTFPYVLISMVNIIHWQFYN
jgi:hypothetical protein